ncbi:MAG: dehypoxanthine futalosine cyclase [Deltaproteobacteria bacterium]|nr:MAG: dehypoxanthine futalosine cyclase [Deltaproteobacteria bacterium]
MLSEAERIAAKAWSGKRLTREEALILWEKADFYTLAALANHRRLILHPEPVVTYVVDRNINYTNICISGCRFCAFYKSPGAEEGYVLSNQELADKIEETLSLGGTQILLQGGLHPDLALSFYEEMLRFMKERFSIHIHGFSPPEIVHMARSEGLEIEEVLVRLQRSGLDSIPGGGAEILVEEVRRSISPHKCTAAQWLAVMESAHGLGLRTTATMMFGHIETFEHRLEHLLRLRQLQDRTSGFTAFIPWSFQPENTALQTSQATAVEYLKTLAISRLVLDNIRNIQVSWVTMGSGVAQVALQFGANDFGSTMIEENVVAAAGVRHRLSVEEIKRTIVEAGYEPRQRNMYYELVDREGGTA